jgi:hypothetical protein
MSLDIICKRLLKLSENPYSMVSEFISDIRLMFKNACIYNEVRTFFITYKRTLQTDIDAHVLTLRLYLFAAGG